MDNTVHKNIPIHELYFDLLLDGQLSETAAVVAGMVGYNYYDFGDTPTLGPSMFLQNNFSRQIYPSDLVQVLFMVRNFYRSNLPVNLNQEFIREGWTETASILCKLNKSL